MSRTELLQDIQGRIERGQPVLILGPKGIGKTWVLQRLAKEFSAAIYIPHISSKKAVLLDLARRLWEDGCLEEFAYFADWADVERRLRPLTIPDLTALVEPHLKDYTILLDNLQLVTEKALLDVVLPLLSARVCAAGRAEARGEERRLNLIANRFHRIELPPLTADEAQAMLWQLLDRSQMRHWQAVETRVLTAANGRPGVIADLAAQLHGTSGSLAEVRSLAHAADYETRVNLLWPVGLVAIAALFAGRYLARSLDDPTLYVLAAVIYATTYLIRPIIYRAR
jgi:energy-coupling factor transporter ATP-binding protein EcfA2